MFHDSIRQSTWRWVSRVINQDAEQHEEVPMTETMLWPRKTRELHNHHFDSTIWNHLQFRDDDIIIATYAKSGTTWMQQIIAQMLYGPDPTLKWQRCRHGSTSASPRRP